VTAPATSFLEAPGWARLLDGARDRFTALGRPGGSFTLASLTTEEAGILRGLPLRVGPGRPREGRPYTVELRRLDLALRATALEVDLATALASAGYAPGNRPAERAALAARRADLLADGLAHPSAADPVIADWVRHMLRSGVLGRMARGQERAMLLAALDLGARLPAEPPIERGRLAVETLAGDPHALDDDRPLARVLLRLLATRAGVPVPHEAREQRLLWQRFGVAVDPLSVDVLALGLAARPDGPVGGALAAIAGRHVRLTLAQLTEPNLRFVPGGSVFVCENPAVIAAAERRLWPRVPPLVCTAGWPNSAVCRLLELLRAAGKRLRHHGDFDWDGVRIHAWLRDRYGVESWRFDAASYRHGIREHPTRTRRLDGRPASTSDDLAAAMVEHDRELHEEAVLDLLVADLRHAAESATRSTDQRPGARSSRRRAAGA
jgi:uncharacterized protein (TIGR02679 family)